MYAIRVVGLVLAPYDTDQWYPCFGLGANFLPTARCHTASNYTALL